MIKSLQLTNFKSFREQVSVDLKPINLIYGENSAGKSTLIQALLLLKQSWRQTRASADDDILDFRGAFIDLGGFGATITDHDYKNNILGLGFAIDAQRRVGSITPFNSQGVSLQFGFGSDGTRKPQIQLASIALDSGFEVNFEHTSKSETAGLFLANAESARNVLDLWLSSEDRRVVYSSQGSRRRRERRQFSDEDVSWAQGWLRKTPCSFLGLLPAWSPEELREGRPGRPVGGSLDSPKRLLLQEFVFDWQFWMSNLYGQIVREFAAVKYVGPLRRAPQRLIVESSEATRELGPRGEQALRVLAADAELLMNLNKSMELLEIPYTFEIRELAGEADTVDIGDISILSLVDSRNGTKLTLGDVGVGVSQVLPVLMQLLLHRDSTILIEQPELHLHPRLQSRLADIIVQSATRQRNTLLIETHSEHLLIRLQRRIRDREVSASRVQVLYVGNRGGNSQAWPIQISRAGSMVGGWPGGFFDERLGDLLGES